MIRPIPASLLLAALVMATTSCSAETENPDRAAANCAAVLGESGVKWIKGNVAKTQVQDLNWDGDGLGRAREQYNRQMESWDPDGQYWESEVCTVSRAPFPVSKRLMLEFGPSSLAFDAPMGGHGNGEVTPVNSDVFLHQRRDSSGVTHYGVYVRCKIKGTPERQETRTPLAGVLSDTLTKGTSDREHMSYLLHATRVMVRSVDCRNKPLVPTKAPAARG
ncbi:hypothetical protein ABZ467_04295 [Streptomyces sp. NPDC005727]|uniref:hypothetical protein n=1 Tax=Streptomyces sp. NPDC005727 TaxID=3157053 RepID=UPI0034032B81